MAKANFKVGSHYGAIGNPKALSVTILSRSSVYGKVTVKFCEFGKNNLKPSDVITSQVIDDDRTEKITYKGVLYSALKVATPIVNNVVAEALAIPVDTQPVDIYEQYYKLNNGTHRVDRYSDHNWRIDGKQYDISVIAKQINGVKGTKDYEAHKDIQIELTMSGNREEAMCWMMTWMMEALAASENRVNVQLRCKFLAAYNTLQSLKGVR